MAMICSISFTMYALLVIFGFFVCFTQAALPANDQPTFHVFNYGLTYYFVDPKFESNFYGANEFCQKNGMQLAAIESPNQNMAIYKGLSKLVGKAPAGFWTSGSRLSSNGEKDFVWLSTGHKVADGYWGTGEPNNKKTQQCIQLYINVYANGYWDDVQCDVVRPAICQSVLF